MARDIEIFFVAQGHQPVEQTFQAIERRQIHNADDEHEEYPQEGMLCDHCIDKSKDGIVVVRTKIVASWLVHDREFDYVPFDNFSPFE